ncbi:beta-1,3-galactosyltransferase 5 [Ambystoma mexicanum]|uniref:beta-1,3-galactosyltransferase 5 n=1 Tax=Ambystoma mexicanum TaxID=8296 RepID=UPI0037E85A85
MMANRRLVFTVILVASCFCFIFMYAVQTNVIQFSFPRFNIRSTIFTNGADSGTFVLLPEAECEQKPPFLVILVTTTHKQVEARAAIRQTWGKDQMIGNKRIAVFFLLGTMTEQDFKAEVNLAAESLVYRDIIQKNFTDTYYNLTLKTVMGLEWVAHFCPQTNFVMKTDTDMFVNVFYLTELLGKKNRTTKFFTGYQKLNETPIRNIFSKWYVSEEEYPEKLYPPFCSGTGYVLSVDLAHDIFTISGSIPFFKLEDVFVGLCLHQLKIKPEPLHSEEIFFAYKIGFSICKFRKIVTCHEIRPSELLMYWTALARSTDEKCDILV